MSAVTITDVRQHIETDLPDAALRRLVEDATDEVTQRFGDDEEMEVTREGEGRFLFLPRRALTVASVVETNTSRSVDTEVTLDTTDWVLRYRGRALERLSGGSHYRSCWWDLVTVTYTPVPEEVIRNRVVIDLVQLAITYKGLIHDETVGDYKATGHLDPKYTAERERILAGIPNRRGLSTQFA